MRSCLIPLLGHFDHFGIRPVSTLIIHQTSYEETSAAVSDGKIGDRFIYLLSLDIVLVFLSRDIVFFI